MCSGYLFSDKSASERDRQAQEILKARNLAAKTGAVIPGNVATVIASNGRLESRGFWMRCGHGLSDGKLLNARCESKV